MLENFWKDILQNEASFNDKAEWLQKLKKTYCRNVTVTNYNIDQKILDKVIKKIQINKAPGSDLINGYWYKSLTSYRYQLSALFNQQIHFDSPLPTLLSAAHTVLLPNSTERQIAKNYRPIACLNVMYKLYSSCINQYPMDHVYKNNIVTPEQVAGKKRVWGTVEQLLITKSILKEVRLMRRNLVTVWLDDRKAFNSVSHSLLHHALKLTKFPNHLLTEIKKLTESWYTKLNLNGKDDSIVSNVIRKITGICQGGSSSVIYFVLALNPLSHLLRSQSDMHMVRIVNINTPTTFLLTI